MAIPTRVLLAVAVSAASWHGCEGFGPLAGGPVRHVGILQHAGRPRASLCGLQMGTAGAEPPEPGGAAPEERPAANGLKRKVLAGAALLSVSVCAPQPSRAGGLDVSGASLLCRTALVVTTARVLARCRACCRQALAVPWCTCAQEGAV